MSILREQLIQIQRRNYLKNLKLVRESLGYNPAVSRYEKEYLRFLKDYRGISDKGELLRAVVASDIVYHGDYHTLKQSQRSILRILREISGKREVVLCLEMFHTADQAHIDRFLAGKSSGNSFLRKIEYSKKWPFSWHHWKPVISFCRERKIPVVGINSDQGEGDRSIKSRDRFSARVIVKTLIRNPGKLIYVVDGDFHVSPNHLPLAVERLLALLDVPMRRLIIYQNAVNLYWRLCREGREESDVLRINEESFCVMNTMPANKIQSYLNWLEFSEDAYYPVHSGWEDESVGQGLSVERIVETIAGLLGLDVPESAFARLAVYYSSSLGFMEMISCIPQLKPGLGRIRRKIADGEGFLLEYGNAGEDAYIIYLPNSNLNMASEEAAHFLNAALRGRLEGRPDPFDAFYRDAVTEALGFFGSKLINEKRKAQSESSLRQLLGRRRQGAGGHPSARVVQTARYILQHYHLQRRSDEPEAFRRKFLPVYSSRRAERWMFSTQLGYMLGNRLYYAVKKGHVPMKRMGEIFCDPLGQPYRAFRVYMMLTNAAKKAGAVRQY